MQRKNEVQHVFLVGAKSLGAYGGYETFVYKLTEYHQNKKNIKYHVACKANGDGCMDETKVDGVTRINDHEFEFHNAHCFKIDIPQIGPAQAIYYDVAALKACCKYIKEHRIKNPIVYIMAYIVIPMHGLLWGIDRVFKYIGFYAVGVFIAGKRVKAVKKKVEAGIVAIVLLALSFFLSCYTAFNKCVDAFCVSIIALIALAIISNFLGL